MRLRYVSLKDAPPLQDLAIPFWQEMIMGRACAIRFVVGVNGSGKSRLLQALTQVFLTVKNFPNVQLPFYVTLVYDLGKGKDKRTIFLQYQKEESNISNSKLILNSYDWLNDDEVYDWENLPNQISSNRFEQYREASSNNDLFLPKALIAYSSGITTTWKKIFTLPLPPFPIPQFEEADERPLDWEIGKERQYLKEQGLSEAPTKLTVYDIDSLRESGIPSIGYFIETKQLRLVVLAATLIQTIKDFRFMPNEEAEIELLKKWDEDSIQNHSYSGFRQLLNEIGWRYPVSIGFKIKFQPNDWIEQDTEKIRDLYTISSRVIAEAEPSNNRTVLFDLKDKKDGKYLLELLIREFKELGKKVVTPFDIFKTLYRWQRIGILQDVVIAFKKRGVDDLMLYDWLSDGEQLFLGRMALFHLLENEDDVLALLDEPETHFNDVWKRRIVDVIDDSLRDTHNEIVITTHSSIALTDVFKKEVTRLSFEANTGKANYIVNHTDTFGASTSVIMREIFGAPESVGQRATEFLDLILMLATKPKEVDAIWEKRISERKLQNSPELNQLVEYLKEAQIRRELPHDYGEENELKNYLIKILISVKKYVEKVRKVKAATVVEALLTLEENIEEGYYQFEIRRRLRALRKPEN